MEEAAENTCNDVLNNKVNETTDDEEPDDHFYRSRSGRVTYKHDYSSINKSDMQLNQIKKTDLNKIPRLSNKKIRENSNKTKKVLKKSSFEDTFRRLIGAMFSQLSRTGEYANTNLNEGERRHGDKSIEALLAELSQSDDMTAFSPIMINDLSNKERKVAPNLLVIIRKKRCGKIKGRVVADGSK